MGIWKKIEALSISSTTDVDKISRAKADINAQLRKLTDERETSRKNITCHQNGMKKLRSNATKRKAALSEALSKEKTNLANISRQIDVLTRAHKFLEFKEEILKLHEELQSKQVEAERRVVEKRIAKMEGILVGLQRFLQESEQEEAFGLSELSDTSASDLEVELPQKRKKSEVPRQDTSKRRRERSSLPDGETAESPEPALDSPNKATVASMDPEPASDSHIEMADGSASPENAERRVDPQFEMTIAPANPGAGRDSGVEVAISSARPETEADRQVEMSVPSNPETGLRSRSGTINASAEPDAGLDPSQVAEKTADPAAGEQSTAADAAGDIAPNNNGLLKTDEELELVGGDGIPGCLGRVTAADVRRFIEAVDEEDNWLDPVMEEKCQKSLRYIIKHGPSKANLAKLTSAQCRYMRGHSSRVPLSAKIGREVVEWIITTSGGKGERRCLYHHWANKNKGDTCNDITALQARESLRDRLAVLKEAASGQGIDITNLANVQDGDPESKDANEEKADDPDKREGDSAGTENGDTDDEELSEAESEQDSTKRKRKAMGKGKGKGNGKGRAAGKGKGKGKGKNDGGETQHEPSAQGEGEPNAQKRKGRAKRTDPVAMEVALSKWLVTGIPGQGSKTPAVGFARCGCSLETAVWSYVLTKTLMIKSETTGEEEGWRWSKQSPRDRAFVLAAIDKYAHLKVDDLFEYRVELEKGKPMYRKVGELEVFDRQIKRLQEAKEAKMKALELETGEHSKGEGPSSKKPKKESGSAGV